MKHDKMYAVGYAAGLLEASGLADVRVPGSAFPPAEWYEGRRAATRDVAGRVLLDAVGAETLAIAAMVLKKHAPEFETLVAERLVGFADILISEIGAGAYTQSLEWVSKFGMAHAGAGAGAAMSSASYGIPGTNLKGPTDGQVEV